MAIEGLLGDSIELEVGGRRQRQFGPAEGDSAADLFQTLGIPHQSIQGGGQTAGLDVDRIKPPGHVPNLLRRSIEQRDRCRNQESHFAKRPRGFIT